MMTHDVKMIADYQKTKVIGVKMMASHQKMIAAHVKMMASLCFGYWGVVAR